MKSLEQQREERKARNELMMRHLVGAASDLATSVTEDEERNGKRAGKKQLMDRLASEALKQGRRRSSRAATAAASERIASAFNEKGAQPTSATASEDEADLSDGVDSDKEDESDEEDIVEVDMQEEPEGQVQRHAQDHQPGTGSSHVHAPSDEERDLQLALALSMQQEDGPSRDLPTEAGMSAAGMLASEASKEDEVGLSNGGRAHDTVAIGKQKRKASALKANKKASKKRKKGLELSRAQIDRVYNFIAEGKVTIGAVEIIEVINKLGLDIDDEMVKAAFDMLQETPFSGPCNRVDKNSFRGFVEDLLTVQQ